MPLGEQQPCLDSPQGAHVKEGPREQLGGKSSQELP